MLTAEQINRLPKWAQREFERLYANERYYEKRLAEGENAKTAVYVSPHVNPRPVADVEDRVRFVAPENRGDHMRYMDVSIDEDGTLKIHGGDSLMILPHVTNVISVRLAR